MELAAGTFQCFRAFLNVCAQQRYIDEAKALVFEQMATLGSSDVDCYHSIAEH